MKIVIVICWQLLSTEISKYQRVSRFDREYFLQRVSDLIPLCTSTLYIYIPHGMVKTCNMNAKLGDWDPKISNIGTIMHGIQIFIFFVSEHPRKMVLIILSVCLRCVIFGSRCSETKNKTQICFPCNMTPILHIFGSQSHNLAFMLQIFTMPWGIQSTKWYQIWYSRSKFENALSYSTSRQ